MLDRQAVLSRPPELPRLSEPFYKFARRHVPVRLSQGNVARRSLAPWMLVLLSNPGALWQPAATTCGVSIRTVALICSCSAVSSRRSPRVCLASALRAYVRVAPARSARTIISVPMLIATKSSFLQLGNSRGLSFENKTLSAARSHASPRPNGRHSHSGDLLYPSPATPTVP